MRKSEIVFSAVAIGISIYFYVESVRFGAGEGSFYRTGFYTQFLAVLMALLVTGLIVKNCWSYLKRKDENKRDKVAKSGRLNTALLFTIGILIISPAILKYIGFVLGGGLFLVSTMVVLSLSISRTKLDWRNMLMIISVSIGILSSIYVLFQLILTIPLPEGLLLF